MNTVRQHLLREREDVHLVGFAMLILIGVAFLVRWLWHLPLEVEIFFQFLSSHGLYSVWTNSWPAWLMKYGV